VGQKGGGGWDGVLGKTEVDAGDHEKRKGSVKSEAGGEPSEGEERNFAPLLEEGYRFGNR